MSEPKRHHYIPIFYLKRWAGEDGRLCEYSRPYRVTRAKRTHPSGTAYVDGLYTVPGVSPENAQFVEKRFMQAVDDGAARAHAIMLLADSKSVDLNARNKIDWARFLYSLLVRNPEQLLKIKQTADENPPQLSESIRDDYDLLRGPNDPPTFEEYEVWSLANPMIMPAPGILPEIINSKRVITEIASMHWPADLPGPVIVVTYRHLHHAKRHDRALYSDMPALGQPPTAVPPKHLFEKRHENSP